MQENKACFTAPEVWSGGFYELLLYLGPPSDDNIRSALRAIWSYPQLEGPYLDRSKEPDLQPIVATGSDSGHLLGVFRNAHQKIPCGTFVIREEDEYGKRLGDFISFYFPLGALSLIFPVGSYPFGSHDDAHDWRAEIDAWLLRLLGTSSKDFIFEAGSVGFEAELSIEGANAIKSGELTRERFDGLVVCSHSGFDWHAPTRYDLIRPR